MSQNDSRSPDFDEAEELRAAATSAGIPETLSPGTFGINLETADEFLARMKINDGTDEFGPRRKALKRRLLVVSGAAVAATLVVLTVVQPWHPSTATADTPPILDYKFAAAGAIAYAPGKDPTSELLELSQVAHHSNQAKPEGEVQHVLTSAMFANISDAGSGKAHAAQVPQTAETWLNPDGSLRSLETNGKPLGPDGRGLTAGAKRQKQPASARNV